MACVCVSPLLGAAEAISLILLCKIDGKRCIFQNGSRIFGACGCSRQVFVNHIARQEHCKCACGDGRCHGGVGHICIGRLFRLICRNGGYDSRTCRRNRDLSPYIGAAWQERPPLPYRSNCDGWVKLARLLAGKVPGIPTAETATDKG